MQSQFVSASNGISSVDFGKTLKQLESLSSVRQEEGAKKIQEMVAVQSKKALAHAEPILGSVNFAIAVKKLNSEIGLTLKDWQLLPNEITSNKKNIEAVITNKKILLNDELQKHLLRLYWKDQAKLLQENPKLVEGLFTSVFNKTLKPFSDKNIQLLQKDPVLMNCLATIDGHLNSVQSIPTQDPKTYEENIKGMKLALGTLHEIGMLCRSEPLQKTALLLNHGLDIAVGLSGLTGKALPAGFTAMGATLGYVGMFVSAVAGIVGMFKKRKGNDNAFAQAILSYLQSISHQIYNMHSDMLRGFEMVTENQKRMMEFMIKSVEHLDLLIRSEAQNTRNAISDLGQHLDSRIDNFMQLTVASGQEIHLQPFYRLMNKIDFYIKDKESATPDKIKKLNYDLSNWIQRDSHFSANPLHTGRIQLTTQRDDLMHYINSEFKDIEQNPEKPLQNMAFLAQIADKAFNVPIVQEGKAIDTAAMPNPLIWLHGAGKYIDFRKEFADVLSDDKDTIVSSMAVADNLFNFIKQLQTNPVIYLKLFEAYEAELVNILSIYKMAAKEANKEINAKLLNIDDAKSLANGQLVFDLTKDSAQSMQVIEQLYEEKIMGKSFKIQFSHSYNGYGGYYVNTGVMPIGGKIIPFAAIKKYLIEQNQNQIVNNLLFLQRLWMIDDKSSFEISVDHYGGSNIGSIDLNVAFENIGSDRQNNNKLNNLFNIKFHLNGDTSSSAKLLKSCKMGRGIGVIESYISGFDKDLASQISDITLGYPQGSLHLNGPTSSMVTPYFKKLIFNKIELASDYETIKLFTQNTLNTYILTKRKNVINELHNASIGHGKEPYQNALKSAYERLDGYKTLLKCYASLAGMSEIDAKLGTSKFPEALSKLPDSKSINAQLSSYLETATIDTPWPIDSLSAPVPAAKKSILDAVNQEAARSKVQAQEEKSISSAMPTIQFISPLQIELSMHFYQLLDLLISLQERPTAKAISEQDEQFINQKYRDCIRHFTLQNKWVKLVDSSWDCYDLLHENLVNVQKILHQDCTDIDEMGRNLSEIITKLLEIHNLLATYYAEKGQVYSLNIEFAKGISEKLIGIQSKLPKTASQVPDSKEEQGEEQLASVQAVGLESARIVLPFFTKSSNSVSAREEKQRTTASELSNLSVAPKVVPVGIKPGDSLLSLNKK